MHTLFVGYVKNILLETAIKENLDQCGMQNRKQRIWKPRQDYIFQIVLGFSVFHVNLYL
jgi:hypothetical protein